MAEGVVSLFMGFHYFQTRNLPELGRVEGGNCPTPMNGGRSDDQIVRANRFSHFRKLRPKARMGSRKRAI
jgi:hypothetical protein